MYSGAVVKALDSASDSQLLERSHVLLCRTLGKSVHLSLLQFRQLCKQVTGYRQWWIFFMRTVLIH